MTRFRITARVPNADPALFQQAAETTKVNCPISALLNAPIILTAELE